MKTYSVLIAWDDHDKEQGDYGTIVRAENEADAETMARAEMRGFHVKNYGTDGDSYLGEDGVFGGSVLELAEGAIWKAAELEQSVRDLLETMFYHTSRPEKIAAVAKARRLLAYIDTGSEPADPSSAHSRARENFDGGKFTGEAHRDLRNFEHGEPVTVAK